MAQRDRAAGGAGASGQMLVQWSPTSTDEERRAFYQERLELFAKMFFWLFVVLLSWVNLMYVVWPAARPELWMVENYVGVAGLITLVTVWRVVLRPNRELSFDALFAWDIVINVVIGIVLGIAGYLAADKPANVYTVFIWATILVSVRVYVIPSSARRTLFISAGVFVPVIAGALAIAVERGQYMGTPGALFVLAGVAYGGAATLLAAIGSQIIFGLRKRVREAQQLGQYTLVEKIGEGGMGTVYRAEHAMLRRPTALKMLPPAKAGADSLARFEREVRLTSQLGHPNTVRIFDYGRSPTGVFYYVMEYLDGIDLERFVRRYGPLPAGRVIHILEQVCGALWEAHDRGLVHRDIKPGNIMLCRRGTVPDVAKVLDFGLVRDLERKSPTTTDLMAGTPAYMPPEAVNDPGAVGPAGDLYAVGAVGYFLLTGTTVFRAANVVEMCVHHVNTEPEPPSSRTDQPIPAELEDLVLRCLLKEPGLRPPSARELRDLLLALEQAAHWDESTAQKWWSINRPPAPGSDRDSDTGHGPGSADTLERPITMTVDLRGRKLRNSVDLGA